MEQFWYIFKRIQEERLSFKVNVAIFFPLLICDLDLFTNSFVMGFWFLLCLYFVRGVTDIYEENPKLLEKSYELYNKKIKSRMFFKEIVDDQYYSNDVVCISLYKHCGFNFFLSNWFLLYVYIDFIVFSIIFLLHSKWIFCCIICGRNIHIISMSNHLLLQQQI